MIDEIFDRHYQSARTQLNASLGDSLARLGKAVTNAFEVLNRIEYSEPWKVTRRRRRVRSAH
jgi:hypothetical protein